MNILILSQWYSPEPIPKPVELAQELRNQGHTVYVITGLPNYPEGVLYNGYRLALRQKETIDGIPVTRTFEFPYHGKRAIGRFANYLSFMASAPLGLWRLPPIDVMYVWHPPLTIGVAAMIISRLRRIPFVYDVQDIWPEAALLSGVMRPGFTVKCLFWLEKMVYKWANHLIVVTKGAKENLIRKGVPPAKVTPLPHWVNESVFTKDDPGLRHRIREQYGWKDRFIVLFAGNLGIVQGLDSVIKAAALVKDRTIHFVFVGDGSDKSRLEALARDLGLNSLVSFIPRQPMENMPGFMMAADILLVHLKDSELSNYVIPTKTMAYLAAGKPIVMAMTGAAADLVAEAKAGFIVPPENPAALAQAVEQARNMPASALDALGANGRNFLLAKFTRKTVVQQYIDLLFSLTGKSNPAREGKDVCAS